MDDDVRIILEAVQFTADKHGVQLRKEGLPYVTHPITVSNTLARKGYGMEYLLTALFHDLMEDTDTTYLEIVDWCSSHCPDKSFHKMIPEAVNLLTTKGKKDPSYFERISGNEIARIVKIVDRFHNLTTMKGLSEKWQRRYIEETWRYIVPLSVGTDFEKDLIDLLKKRERMIANHRR